MALGLLLLAGCFGQQQKPAPPPTESANSPAALVVAGDGLKVAEEQAVRLPAPENSRQPYVVLIGIGAYADPDIKPRPSAEADAQALYDLFADERYLGVDRDHVRLLLGAPDRKRGSSPATRGHILAALHWATGAAGPDGTVVVAWIGQGAPVGSRFCYFTHDSTFAGRADTAVTGADLRAALNRLPGSPRFCGLIDVDFQGFRAERDQAPVAHLDRLYEEFTPGDDESPPLGRVILLASRGLRPPPDQDGHGQFTRVILDGLRGRADREGGEPDGWVTADELAAHVERAPPAGPAGRRRGKGRTVCAPNGLWPLRPDPESGGDGQAPRSARASGRTGPGRGDPR
jgi:hypothetical protein